MYMNIYVYTCTHQKKGFCFIHAVSVFIDLKTLTAGLFNHWRGWC